MNTAFLSLPDLLPRENAVSLEIQEGAIIFRSSSAVKDRIEHLVEKEKTIGLTRDEKRELDGFEEIDDYLSQVNRLIRNSAMSGEIPLAS